MISKPDTATARKVFISYSWDGDGETNEQWVANLATKLKNNGLDILLDKWHVKPGDPITAFMQQAIANSDKIVMICTPRYKRSADGIIGAVGYETNIIASQIWLTADHRRFIPVLKHGSLYESIPIGLQGKYFIDLSIESAFDQQYEILTNALACKCDPSKNDNETDSPKNHRIVHHDYNNLSFAVLEKLDKKSIGRYISYYREKIIKNPQNDQPYFGLGLCALHYGMTEFAMDKLKRALDLNPPVAEYHYYYGLSICSKNLLSELGISEIYKAVECIITAIKLDACQAKYYCFLLLICYCRPDLPKDIFEGWDLNALQQKSRCNYRDENEVKRLISIVKTKDYSKINLLI